MSLENIQLPDFLIAELYRDALVELDYSADGTTSTPSQSNKTELVTAKNTLRYLGENKRNVCILVNEAEAIYMDAEDLTFLTNVLKACQLNMGDIAVININQQTVSHTQLAGELQPKHVLLFDVEPITIGLPFNIPDFQPQPFAGSVYMKAPSLRSINQPSQEARILKTNLWINLQKIFEINT